MIVTIVKRSCLQVHIRSKVFPSIDFVPRIIVCTNMSLDIVVVKYLECGGLSELLTISAKPTLILNLCVCRHLVGLNSDTPGAMYLPGESNTTY